MKIEISNPEDIDNIFRLYDEATHYQSVVGIKKWVGFERELIEKEIRDGRQYKIIEDGQMACVFVYTFNDPFIWKEKDQDPAIYLHRIATNPLFRGRSYVKHIVEWARQFGGQHGKQFIRMDTGSGNDRLNNYYISCGFAYLGISQVSAQADLPAHYLGSGMSLFEMKL